MALRMSSDPPAALLTDAQRGYLRGDPEEQPPTDPAERSLRSRIRTRMQAGILDFSVLFEHLSPQDRSSAFAMDGEVDVADLQLNWDMSGGFLGPDEEVTVAPTPELEQGFIDAVAFLWLAALDAGISPKDLMETGIERGYTRQYPDQIASPTLDLNADYRHLIADKGAKKMRTGDELTDREVRALLEEDRVDPADVASHLRGEYEWPPEDVDPIPYGTEVTQFMGDDDEPDLSGTIAEVDEDAQETVIKTLVDDASVSFEGLADEAGISEQLAQEVVSHRQEEIRERILEARDDDK
jgi:hypothetical protein